MTELDKKANEIYQGLVVRKDLVKEVKGNAIVPSYVLEYLLGQYCATDDQESVTTGIQTVKDILVAHYVHRNEANRIRAEINERGSKKVIDKIEVAFNDKKGTYEATFSNLGLTKVPVDSDTVNRNKKLLVSGIWCIASVSYCATEEKDESPWNIDSLKPIQLSNIDFEGFKEGRKSFSQSEWVDLLVHSIGFNPEAFSEKPSLEPVHLQSPDGASGLSYDRLFGKYLEGATEINIQDPYLLTWIQLKNFLEFLNVVARRKSAEDEIVVNLVTIKDRANEGFFNQNSNLGLMQDRFVMQGIKLNYTFDESEKIHARGITTNTGWKIIIDRGLDIFQKYNTKDFFSVQATLQEARKCRAFEMTIIRV